MKPCCILHGQSIKTTCVFSMDRPKVVGEGMTLLVRPLLILPRVTLCYPRYPTPDNPRGPRPQPRGEQVRARGDTSSSSRAGGETSSSPGDTSTSPGLGRAVTGRRPRGGGGRPTSPGRQARSHLRLWG